MALNPKEEFMSSHYPLRALLAVAAVAAVLGAGPAGASWGGTGRIALAIGPNRNVSRLPGNQAETTIAINPTNPSNIVVASNIQFGSGLFKAYSLDGGTTWNGDLIGDGDNLGLACCDPSLAFDSFGNLFLVYIDDVKFRNIQLAMSTDGGATFSFVTSVERSDNGGPNPLVHKWGAFVDQPTVVTGPDSVWVTYKYFSHNQRIQARGAPVSGLGRLGAFHKPERVPGSREGSFGDIVVGPDGQVMVTYQDNIPSEGPSTIFVNLDPDGLGPSGFDPSIPVTSTNVGGFDYIPPQSKRSVDAEAGLAWDRSGGPHTGRVYLMYTDENPNESGDTDVLVRYSDDQGATWTTPVRVNDDTGTNSQFLPRIALDQTTGFIAVSWHDSRNDLGAGGPGDTDGIPDDDAQFFATVSTDGGLTFQTNVQVSEGTSNAADAHNGVEYGDYTGLFYLGGNFYPSWADNSNSTGDNPDGTLLTFDVYTAKVTLG
jgi:hypothetical protein